MARYRRRSTRKPRRAPRRNYRVRRSIRSSHPVFTETYLMSNANGGEISLAGGFSYQGVWTVSMAQIPQLAQYSGLYSRYKVLKAQLMLLPDFLSADFNQAQSNTAGAQSRSGITRLAYAINNTPQTPVPANEAALLKDNGCKIKYLNNKQIIKFRPVPNLETNGTLTEVVFSKNPWINFDSALPPAYFGVAYSLTTPGGGPAPNPQDILHVYVKVTFCLADPR